MSAPVSRLDGVVPGFARALRTFRSAAATVPAYREFLDAHGVDPATVHTPDDFAAVPAVTKQNYVAAYPRNELFPAGAITGAGIWSTSTGSSGTPTYWPRGPVAAEQSIIQYDRLFRHSFASHEIPTLLVIGFALGNWIGGTYTLAAALELPRLGHKLSVVAPGFDLDAILANIAELGPHYAQVVLAGYPPFLKDVLDAAGPQVRSQRIRLLMAGEKISETWRDRVLAPIDAPAAQSSLIYGTADAGIMGFETPTTIALRRAAGDDPALHEALFGAVDVAPTFVEYDPRLRFTEVDADGHLLFTVAGAMPLVRYRIKDEGSVLSATEVANLAGTQGIPFTTAAERAGFIALRGRSDVAASFYAVKLYPESIKPVLERPDLAAVLSGKFSLSVPDPDADRPDLVLDVELARNAGGDAALAAVVRERVVAQLIRTSTEYRALHADKGAAAEPVVRLHTFGSTTFRYDVKVRWAS